MKNVLSNTNEVCHFWANEKQESGKAGNIFFEDKTIYSYGRHFPIARNLPNNIVLFTTRSYSSSTAKHISRARCAIPHNKTVIAVEHVQDFGNEGDKEYTPQPFPSDMIHNLSGMKDDIEDTLKKALRARSNKDYLLQSASGALANMQKYLDLRGKYLTGTYLKSRKKYTAFIAEINMALETGTIPEQLKQEEIKRKQEEKLAATRLLKENKEKIQAWVDGTAYSFPYDVKKIYLRLNADRDAVQTSKNASVSIAEAKTLWNMIKHGKAIRGEVLSGYTVLAYDGQELKIGCHVIEKDEIDRIGKILDETITSDKRTDEIQNSL